jgi:predicted nucleic-acid-binding protein
VIGVDTNVLVRLFVVDDHRQHEAAKRFFSGRSASDPAFVSLVVVAELVWLLDDTYEFSLAEIVNALNGLLASQDFVVEERNFVAAATTLAGQRRIDIADFLIARIASSNGCLATYTFDQKAAQRIPGMALLK